MSENKHKAETTPGSEAVARVYAEALLNATDAANNADEVRGELDALLDEVFEQQPELEGLLLGGALGRDHRRDLIEEVFLGNASETFTNFLFVLNDQERLDELYGIRSELVTLLNERQNKLPVEVTSAVVLDDAQMAKIKQQLKETFDKDPLIEARVDEDILGGLVLRVGDWLYDASVRTRVENMRDNLIEGASHELEDGRDRFGTFGTDS